MNLTSHINLTQFFNISPDLLELCGEEPDEELVQFYRWLICGIMITCTACIGSVGNCLSLCVLCSRGMSSMFNHLLACLCCADTLFLLSAIVEAPYNLGVVEAGEGVSSYITPCVEASCHFSHSASIFLIICVTVERYQAVCFPFSYQARAHESGKRRLFMHYILPVIMCSLFFNTTRFIQISPIGLELQTRPTYVKFLLFFQAFHPLSTTGFIPLFLLSILNYKVYSHMTRAKIFRTTRRKSKEFVLAKIMMILVIVFLILNTPRLILGIVEVSSLGAVETCYQHNINYSATLFTYIADFTAKYCAVVNSSINFLIYCMFGAEFRWKLKKLLGLHENAEISNLDGFSMIKPEIAQEGGDPISTLAQLC